MKQLQMLYSIRVKEDLILVCGSVFLIGEVDTKVEEK